MVLQFTKKSLKDAQTALEQSQRIAATHFEFREALAKELARTRTQRREPAPLWSQAAGAAGLHPPRARPWLSAGQHPRAAEPVGSSRHALRRRRRHRAAPAAIGARPDRPAAGPAAGAEPHAGPMRAWDDLGLQGHRGAGRSRALPARPSRRWRAVIGVSPWR